MVQENITRDAIIEKLQEELLRKQFKVGYVIGITQTATISGVAYTIVYADKEIPKFLKNPFKYIANSINNGLRYTYYIFANQVILGQVMFYKYLERFDNYSDDLIDYVFTPLIGATIGTGIAVCTSLISSIVMNNTKSIKQNIYSGMLSMISSSASSGWKWIKEDVVKYILIQQYLKK